MTYCFIIHLRFKNSENTIVRDYVLPDYANIRQGYARSNEESDGKAKDSEQVLTETLINLDLKI